jgi:hypothetical protein
MKDSPSKGAKAGAGAGKKRSRNEVEGSAQGSTPPMSPPRPNPNKEWKKSKRKTKDLLALVNSGWCAASGDPYQMEKNPDEVPMFARFVERELALPACHTCFSKEKQVHIYMYSRIYFHTYSDI